MPILLAISPKVYPSRDQHSSNIRLSSSNQSDATHCLWVSNAIAFPTFLFNSYFLFILNYVLFARTCLSLFYTSNFGILLKLAEGKQSKYFSNLHNRYTKLNLQCYRQKCNCNHCRLTQLQCYALGIYSPQHRKPGNHL